MSVTNSQKIKSYFILIKCFTNVTNCEINLLKKKKYIVRIY